ncbi:hypothetical protein [Sphingomonas segetis]|jgi:ElaB/YqjD/DUF883 family membrane-anchored ribosome-binding protein|uniref:hypothetical protein n=1 Tax=Sphingomonas segetis TaxID=1104779 RepID=UPI0012D3641B|nr:hypothetical protein [Sphingomonas segetis]
MADQRTDDLPEGTDTVIEGANVGAITTDPTAPDQGGQTIAIEDTVLVEEKKVSAPKVDVERDVTGSGSPKGGLANSSGGPGRGTAQGIADRIRSGREQLSSQAGDKARGLVSQGLERTSEALANVARMVGDTAPGIDERLGEDYGGYARRAAGAIENVANTIAEKNPDELIEDTRNFVRNSPGIALAGAAVVGFVVARLVKSGLARDERDDDED